MLKRDELSHPNGCLAKADDNEMIFVLLARDEAAPETIRFWCARRVLMGKNKESDSKIKEALACAEEMERQKTIMEQR